LFAEMYVRARGDLPDQDPGREFADREVKLATTIGGAGVVHGDLTAECAAAVAAVLDALAAPAGKDDDRTKGQRYYDALAEAIRWLWFCIMIALPADLAHAPLRAGAYSRLGGACDAAKSVPAQPPSLERGTGHARLARPATPGQHQGHRGAPGPGNGDPAAARELRLSDLMPAVNLRRPGHGDRGRVLDPLREPVPDSGAPRVLRAGLPR
jgi:hypothetical protein